jgi:hypothetical protein
LYKLKMRALAFAVLLSVVAAADASAARAARRLKVAPDGRFLLKDDGSPFFYLGDTAWELFHRLDREEADEYLRDRAARGFTVIQAVVLAELDGLGVPNPYGHLPLKGRDPTRPDEAYFRHVDYVVNRARELGLHVGMLPTWGDKWNKKWGVGPEVFTPGSAERFGEFLGRRYRESPVIWILGGDRSPESDAHLAIVRALAKGLKKGDAGRHLMTYHPMGGASSSRWFHGDDWLDFNMFQSGHSAKDAPNYEHTAADYRLAPFKPTLDGEPRYEDHPVDWKPEEKGWFDDFDVRQAAYWSVLAGACGHTYGNHNIWQMWRPGREPISYARTPWRKALSHPGAAQMGHLRRLFESRPFLGLAPDQTLLAGDPVGGAGHLRAARAADGGFAFAYTPEGRKLVVALGKIKGNFVRAYWYNPRDGASTFAGRFGGGGTREFAPPSSGRGHDWVLVLDDESRGFPPPGAKKS